MCMLASLYGSTNDNIYNPHITFETLHKTHAHKFVYFVYYYVYKKSTFALHLSTIARTFNYRGRTHSQRTNTNKHLKSESINFG